MSIPPSPAAAVSAAQVHCLNCGALLSGTYCASCGQRHQTHPPTVRHLLAELAEGLTHADSRLWVTLRYLLTRPGFLTREFFAGRRERYLPPIRLYIVVSLAYFLMLALLPETSSPSMSVGTTPTPSLEASGADLDCRDLKVSGWSAPWLAQRLQEACLRMQQDSGIQFGKAFMRAIPRSMFVLLPLFALVMLAFYWRPRRLYAEHVLLLMHNHSACFLLLGVEHILSSVLPAGLMEWITPVVLLYLCWTVWRSVDVYYAQPRRLALAKVVILAMLYTVSATLVLVFTGVATVLSL